VILLPSLSTAQYGVATPTSPPAPEQQWQTAPCGSCQRAGVSFEFRQSPNEGREPGAFIIARLRNLTGREVAGSIELLDAELPDSEGHIPSQMLWFVLGPTDNEHGDLVLLRRRTPVKVIVHNVAQW
jgi:hypothetical protein